MTVLERLYEASQADSWPDDLRADCIDHIERMEMALRDAQRQFLFYERNHRAKIGNMATIVETQATVAKADANKMMAKICEDALIGEDHPAIGALVALADHAWDLWVRGGPITPEILRKIEHAKRIADRIRPPRVEGAPDADPG